jgi:hypothetical protein
MGQLRELLEREPPELELSVVELAAGTPAAGEPAATELAFGMVLRRGERERGGHSDITDYGGWRAYRAR